MKQLHDFRTWFAVAGIVAILMVLFGTQGKAWALLMLPMAIGIAVRFKYGDDEQAEISLPSVEK